MTVCKCADVLYIYSLFDPRLKKPENDSCHPVSYYSKMHNGQSKGKKRNILHIPRGFNIVCHNCHNADFDDGIAGAKSHKWQIALSVKSYCNFLRSWLSPSTAACSAQELKNELMLKWGQSKSRGKQRWHPCAGWLQKFFSPLQKDHQFIAYQPT